MISAVSSVPSSRALIETANWRDLNALWHLEKVCFSQDAWPLWDLIGVLTLPNVVRLKAVQDNTMVGFIAGDLRPTQNQAWIATLGVLPEYRGQGIGRALLEACEGQLHMACIRLSVRVSNHAAIQLYRNSGYQKAGLWPVYYEDGEDALLMEKLR